MWSRERQISLPRCTGEVIVSLVHLYEGRSKVSRIRRTKALAYVPSRPYKANGGFESGAATWAYVLRDGPMLAQTFREGATRELTVFNCWDSIFKEGAKQMDGGYS